MISNIHWDKVKQSIFSGIQKMCAQLSIHIVAEGVETAEEYNWLGNEGVNFFQGFYFAEPAFESLPSVTF